MLLAESFFAHLIVNISAAMLCRPVKFSVNYAVWLRTGYATCVTASHYAVVH